MNNFQTQFFLGRNAQYKGQNVINLSLEADSNKLIKQGIWLYFFLLLFEGALRKWFLPGLAAPLLVIRDPLALGLIFLTWKRGLLPKNFYLGGMIVIGIVGLYTALIFGHGNFTVALFGARILLIQFPLIFVIGSIFNRDDVIKMGKAMLWISIPMVILITLQFYSPQSAWVNRGVGGDIDGAGFSGAMGYLRPPGTFSFTNGNALFFSLLAPFVLFFWLEKKNINTLILIAATAALLFAIPISISRAFLFRLGISLIFAIVAISRKPQYLGRMLIAIFGGLTLLAILSQTSFFQTATMAFTSRFENANKTEGGLEGVFLDRFLGGLIGSLGGAGSINLPFFGYGLGLGTNVGSVLMSGSRTFLIAEEEWGRVVGELGPLMGISVIILRVGLTAKIAFASYKRLVHGDLLPWMLLSFGLLVVAQSQWAQPTSLGFCVLIGGLIIASFNSLKDPEQESQKNQEKPVAI